MFFRDVLNKSSSHPADCVVAEVFLGIIGALASEQPTIVIIWYITLLISRRMTLRSSFSLYLFYRMVFFFFLFFFSKN